MNRSKEIMAPCRSVREAKTLIAAGADSTYTGISGFCRWEKGGVSLREFLALAESVISLGGRPFAAFNNLPAPGRTGGFLDAMRTCVDKGAGLIVKDLGLLRQARRFFPDCDIVASIGVNVCSSEDVRLLEELGASRVVLSTTLTPAEVCMIRERSGIRIELLIGSPRDFIAPGRCLLGSYAEGRAVSGNCRFICTRPFSTGGAPVETAPRFCHNDKDIVEYAPYVDCVKIGGGEMKGEALQGFIRSLRAALEKAAPVRDGEAPEMAGAAPEMAGAAPEMDGEAPEMAVAAHARDGAPPVRGRE